MIRDRIAPAFSQLAIAYVLVVKRLAMHPAGQRVTIQSDNPAYPDGPECDIDDVQCIGGVIWAGRKIG